MKTNILKLAKILLFAVLSIFVVSCSRDSVEEELAPTNELVEKGHDEWSKVEIIIREGHLHGANFHGNPEMNIPILPKIQKITFTRTANGVERIIEKGNTLKKDLQAVEVIAGEARYAMEIIYYNEQGERMNYQFITPEQLNIHQHFFTINEYTDLAGGNVQRARTGEFFTDLHDYVYRDTKPEDRMVGPGVELLRNNPVGLKGYFNFKKGGIKFNLAVRLNHFYTSKFNADGSTDSAINPSVRARVQATTDLLQEIPFVVIGFNGKKANENDDSAVDRYIREVADYYGLTEDEVEEYIIGSDVDPESGSFWM